MGGPSSANTNKLSGRIPAIVTAIPLICLIFSSFLLVAGDAGAAEPPRVSAQEGDDELVMEFKRFYSKDRSVRERIEAILVLDGVNTVEATKTLSEVFDDEDFKVRQAAIETIGSYDGPGSAQFLIETFLTNKREKNAQRKACAAETLGLMGSVAAVGPLAETFRRTKDWDLKRAIATALGGIKAEEGIPVLLGLLGDKDATLRITAIDALAATKMPALCQDEIFRVMAEDSNWQVRAAAIEAARSLRTRECIQPLIDRLREEEGRLRGDAYLVLKDLTFNTYSEDAEQWQKFWDRAKDTYELPDYDKVMASRKKREREGTRYKEAAAQFVGIPTKSKRIIFVIDISGSMETQVVEIDRFRANGKDYASFQRLEIVKTELINTIENLNSNVEFNILAFATKLKWWKKKLVGSNILNRNSAIKFVRGLKPLGGAMAGFRSRAGLSQAALEEGKTNTFGALMAALGVPEESSSRTYDRNLKSDVDTIYFLSDGAPTVGKVIDQDEILAEVKRVNKVRKIVLHTIAIGDFRKTLMKALAKGNGGVYVDLGK